ncbi:MAG: hypothetical protein ACI4M6_00850 [Christensenellaceae bacterium]
MFKNAVAVLDIRSSSVTALIGERSVNNNFTIRAICERFHEGYCKDGFLDLQSTRKAVCEAVDNVLRIANVTLNEIFVGVPDAFTVIRNANSKYVLNRKRRIGDKDIESFLSLRQPEINVEGYCVVDKSWVNCFIDANNRVYTPYKQVSTSISGYLTYYLADERYLNFVKECLARYKIKSVVFIPSVIAESKFLFTREERYSYEILLDVGYISSSLSILMGDGVLAHFSFDTGIGFLTAYLAQRINIDFCVAELLTKKLNLSLSRSDGSYNVFYEGKGYSFNIESVNEICKEFLSELCESIDNAITDSRVRLPNKNICISLTGGGLSDIRGAMEFMSSVLEMRINLVAPSVPFMNKPEESSKLSLLDYALNYKNKYRK